MKKVSFRIVKIAAIIYLGICVALYFFQEHLIFFPDKIAKDYQFEFDQNFEELTFKTDDKKLLHGVLFKSDSSKGLVFYLHVNGGSVGSWGEIAKTYTDLNYDLFVLDYRGYGKSEGSISSEREFHKDVQLVYDQFKLKYHEDHIIIVGYSIGTGAATKLASANHPKLLILQAPYYSLTDLIKHKYPVISGFILRYHFETNKFLKECKMPVLIFHGNNDKLIYYESSLKLKKLFKENDKLIIINGWGHREMSDQPEYLMEVRRILGE
ncbi:MAG: alpha/beta fold hydrolase [Daejeonella sp.]